MNCHARVQHKREVLSLKSFVRKRLPVFRNIISFAINKENIKSQKIATLQPNGSFGGGKSAKNKSYEICELVLITNNERDNYRGRQSLTRTFSKHQLKGKVFYLYGKQWRVL